MGGVTDKAWSQMLWRYVRQMKVGEEGEVYI